MTDAQTLDVYAKAAKRYAERFARLKDADQVEDLQAFCAALPPGGRVLDLGCGPGQWAASLQEAGFQVEATDASPEMAALAAEHFGLNVTVATFDDLNAQARYDGIWASFSLLHAPRAAFPGHLQQIHRALKPKGVFLIGMKLGEAEGRDHLGRFYSYYEEAELKTLLTTAGFTVTSSRTATGKGLAGTDDTFVVILSHA